MKYLKYIITLVFSFFLSMIVLGQDFSDIPGFDEVVDDETPAAAPIDGLIALGIAAGAVYGYLKIKKEDI